MEWVRQGRLGQGIQVKAGTVQDALGALGKTFELAGISNPTYKPGTNQLDTRLQRQLEALRRSDPPTRPQLAVPAAVPHWIYDQAQLSKSPHVRAVGELCIIAFYFLLRVGEYTQTQINRSTRTQQFRVSDVIFFRNQQPMTHAKLVNTSCPPDLVRLRIDNQRMASMGKSSRTMQPVTATVLSKHVQNGSLLYYKMVQVPTHPSVPTDPTLEHLLRMSPTMILSMRSVPHLSPPAPLAEATQISWLAHIHFVQVAPWPYSTMVSMWQKS